MSIAGLPANLWKDELWLPQNVNWSEIQREGNYPKSADLLYCLPIALVIVFFRIVVEKLLFIPFGLICQIGKQNFRTNEELEKAFVQGCRSNSPLKHLAQKLKWTEQQVHKWLRQRERIQKISVKFNESGWRATFYSFAFLYGINCLWTKPWFWNVAECWTNRSTFIVPTDIWWYYLVELAFYISLMISQFVDVKRKDFWQMMLHHFIAIALISMSWMLNCVRVGSLIMLCHDIGDIPLEIAKLFGYLKMKLCCDVTFLIFLIIWFISRLGIYPFILMRTSWFDSNQVIGPLPRYIINFMLLVLFFLHLIWTWMILRIVKTFISGNPKDVRSDSEDSSDSSEKKEN